MEADHFHICYPAGGIAPAQFVHLVDSQNWVACTTRLDASAASSGVSDDAADDDDVDRDAAKAPCGEGDLEGISDVKVAMLYRAVAGLYPFLRTAELRVYANDLLT